NRRQIRHRVLPVRRGVGEVGVVPGRPQPRRGRSEAKARSDEAFTPRARRWMAEVLSHKQGSSGPPPPSAAPTSLSTAKRLVSAASRHYLPKQPTGPSDV